MRTEMLTAAQQASPVRGLFRLGVAETLVHTWLPELLERLHTRHPALVVELQVDTSHVLHAQMLAHQIDLAMLVGTSQDPREHRLHLWDYSLAWVASPSLRLHGRTVAIEELASYPIITYPPASVPHQAVKRILQDAGIKEPRLHGSASLSTIVHLARHGMGPCVIAPAVIAEELEQGKLRILRTDGTPLPDIGFHACWLDTPDSHTALTVARMAQEIAHQAGARKRQ